AGVAGELHHDARTRLVDRDAELLRHLTKLRGVVGARPLTPTVRRRVGVRVERLNPQRQCVGCDVLTDTAVRIRTRRAAASATESAQAANATAGGVQDG